MKTFHYQNYIKYIFVLLVIYNLISLFILFSPIKSIKFKYWNLTPYDYKFGLNFPNDLEDLSLLNEFNRIKISSFLKKNENRNALNINFWNKNFFIDDYSKDKNKNFEKSFQNLFLLTQNNKTKNFQLKKYFILNYDSFSSKTQKIIIDNYN